MEVKKKRGGRGLVKIALYVLLVAAMIVFLISKRDKFAILVDIPRYKLLGLFAISFLPVFFNALSFKMDTSIFDLNLKFREWFGLSVVNTFYNYIFPAHSGMAIRAGYLKKRHNFPVSRYLCFLSASYLIVFFVSTVTATSISLIYRFSSEGFHAGFLYLSAGLLFFTIVLFFFLDRLKSEFFSKNNRITQFLQNSVESIAFFKLNKNKIKYIVMCKFFFLISVSLRLFFAYSVLGIHIAYMKILLTSSFLVFAMIMSIVPGDLGVKEGIIGISTSIMGLSIEDALIGAVLDRMVSMIVVFSLGLVFHYVLFFKK